MDHVPITPTIAIVGSGVAGCYVAQALRRALPQAELCILDRLPVPYGLLRYGVAADHQGTKALSRQFDRLFLRDGVRFAGNIDIGTTLSLAALRETFDATVLATGLHGDRPLAIEGSDRPHVIGAGRLTRLLNAHPDEADFLPMLGASPVIIGAGNVAIDVARLLAKPPELMADSDIAAIHADVRRAVRHISIVGRSPGGAAKCDVTMLEELGRIPRLRVTLSGTLEPGDADRAAALRALAARDDGPPACTIAFHFGWHPASIAEDSVHFTADAASDTTLALPASAVITATGFTACSSRDIALQPLTTPMADPATGRLDIDLYCTGWCRRGAQGAIPSNREDARTVADAMARTLSERQLGKPGFQGLSEPIRTATVDFAGWQRIDQLERSTAEPGRLRRKIVHFDHLLAAARG